MNSVNYGNRLQNYALQESIKKNNVIVETIHNPFEKTYSNKKYLFKRLLRKVVFYICRNDLKYSQVIREENFEKFDKEYVVFSKRWLNNSKHCKLLNAEYNSFVCGSDQVWNSEAKQIDERWFAFFADKRKRNSYAASFGLNYIYKERREEFKKYLMGMNHISVREKSGIDIVNDLCSRKAECHIDPTMLLDINEWKKIEKKPASFCPDSYLLTYFLGKKTIDIENAIKKIEEKYDLKVINLNDKNQLEYYIVSPSEFIYLFSHARYIITDSFHGTVFSCLFHKPFTVCDRVGTDHAMFTRIDNLLDMFDLNDRKLSVQNDFSEDINFSNIQTVLDEERKKSFDYLKKVIDSSR